MVTLANKDLLIEYVRRDFYQSNINKYYKYFDEWYSNLTDIQLEFWQKRMLNADKSLSIIKEC